jgi:hypothetical protein
LAGVSGTTRLGWKTAGLRFLRCMRMAEFPEGAAALELRGGIVNALRTGGHFISPNSSHPALSHSLASCFLLRYGFCP